MTHYENWIKIKCGVMLWLSGLFGGLAIRSSSSLWQYIFITLGWVLLIVSMDYYIDMKWRNHEHREN